MKKGGKMSAHSPTGLFIIFYQYAYPSEPKIDGVGSAKKYKKIQSTFLVNRNVME